MHSLWHDFENMKQAASVSIWLILFFHIFFSFVDGHDANKYFQTVYNVIDHKLLCINEMKKPVGFDSFNIRLGKDEKKNDLQGDIDWLLFRLSIKMVEHVW